MKRRPSSHVSAPLETAAQIQNMVEGRHSRHLGEDEVVDADERSFSESRRFDQFIRNRCPEHQRAAAIHAAFDKGASMYSVNSPPNGSAFTGANRKP